MSKVQPITLKRNRWTFWKKGQPEGKVAEKDESFYRAG